MNESHFMLVNLYGKFMTLARPHTLFSPPPATHDTFGVGIRELSSLLLSLQLVLNHLVDVFVCVFVDPNDMSESTASDEIDSLIDKSSRKRNMEIVFVSPSFEA